jgi:hypothetical protein
MRISLKGAEKWIFHVKSKNLENYSSVLSVKVTWTEISKIHFAFGKIIGHGAPESVVDSIEHALCSDQEFEVNISEVWVII